MSFLQVENSDPFTHSSIYGNDQFSGEISNALSAFDRLLRKYFFFYAALFVLVLTEIASMVYFYSELNQSALVSIGLSVIFLTIFAYFILHVYWQTNKAQQLIDIKNSFVDKVEELLNYEEEIPECHISMANALCKLAESINGREYSYYTPPGWLNLAATTLEKLSCWVYWKDCFRFKEIALTSAVEEQVMLVKCEPTNPDTHTSLANAYILLTGLYALSHSQDEGESLWGPSKKDLAEMSEKFRIASERAIEELKILSNFAPNDPWVHEQLAYSYRDMQMPAEEILEYERILRLMPSNNEILFKLGVLYFEQGKNVQGLQLYEQLRHSNYKKAQALIKHYGAYSPM